MEEFVEAAVKIGGEACLIGTAIYAGIKRSYPLFVVAVALAIYFVDEALRTL
jgi:hypothetical protein